MSVVDLATERLKKAQQNSADLPEEKTSKVEKLVGLVSAAGRLASDAAGGVYFLPSGATVMNIESRRFADYVVALGRSEGMILDSRAVTATILNLRGDALASKTKIEPCVRVAGDDRTIYIHLGGDDVVVVTSEGWKVDAWDSSPSNPAVFLEPSGFERLPTPVRGGLVKELREVLNVGDEGFALVVMWMLSALRPKSPCPILGFVGPKGSAKSTATKIVRSLIDPNAIPLRALPRKEHDLGVAAQHSLVLAFDNLSGLGNDSSDALCRTATGGGLGSRTLYTNSEETVLKVLRPIILNGIDDLGSRADLGSRMYLARLEVPKERRTEQQIEAALEAMAPRVFGALLDALAVAMRDVEKVDPPQFRMSAAAQWAFAAESTLGFEARAFNAALQNSADELREVAVEASPIGRALEAFIETRKPGEKPWEGSATELETELKRAYPLGQNAEGWPKSTSRFSVEVGRIASDVAGAKVERTSTGRGAERRNVFRITKPL